MHDMQTIAINDLSLCLSVTLLHHANTTKGFKVLLGMKTLEDPRNIALDRRSDFPHEFNAAFASYFGHLLTKIIS